MTVNKIISHDYKIYPNYYFKYKDKSTLSVDIIIASYNCEKYLERLIESILIKENENFDIFIIFVDDGSFDGTKNKIHQYIKKFPNKIKYIYQTNNGQASARQNGLKYSQKEWVTFIDADDFLDRNYFLEINEQMRRFRNVNIFCGRNIIFSEIDGTENYNHPLDFKFRNRVPGCLKNLKKSPDYVHLFVNTTFFKSELIKKCGIKFEEIKPSFEDATFIAKYIINTDSYNVCFVKKAKYNYVKRADKSSTLDKGKYETYKYVDFLKDAYIKLLKYSDENFIKYLVAYDLSWNLKDVFSTKTILSSTEREKRMNYIKEIYEIINYEILSRCHGSYYGYDLIKMNFNYYNNVYKEKAHAKHFYTTNKHSIFLLFAYEDKWSFIVDNKTYKLKQLDTRIYYDKVNNVNRVYAHIDSKCKTIKIMYNEKKIKTFKMKNKQKYLNKESNLLFFDRDIKADDNAEVLYEYMKNSGFKNMVFAISQQCDDYKRLKNKEFNLVDYGSEKFQKIYNQSDFIFSSGINEEIENYEGMRHYYKKCQANFVFLQHGVITDNLREWLSFKRIDKIVVSSFFEDEKLKNEYHFNNSQVINLGLCRFDKLQAKNSNIISFMPTWRLYYKDFSEEEFFQTDYARNIILFISSSKLSKVLQSSNYVLEVIMHPELSKYYEYFKNYENANIKISDPLKINYSLIIEKSNLLITDYSSVFNDFIYLNKPVIFYQEDKEVFFKNHLYSSDMDYETENIGKVCYSIDDLINQVSLQIKVNFTSTIKSENYFINTQKNHCQGLVNALLEESNES